LILGSKSGSQIDEAYFLENGCEIVHTVVTSQANYEFYIIYYGYDRKNNENLNLNEGDAHDE
jgi:uncharacterized protein YfaP (DUF2135 family)